MAEVIQRVWRSGPRRVKRLAWGYSVQVNGRQVRVTNQEWTEEDAEKALAARLLGLTPAPKTPGGMLTLGTMAETYLRQKEADGKRTLRNDRLVVAHLLTAFGQETPLRDLTAARIQDYSAERLTAKSERLGRPVTPATVNREVSILRCLLRMAQERGDLERVPRIRLTREPEGRLRFLTEPEANRLLASCRAPKRVEQSPHLPAIVTVALNTGMRKGEILGLAWERVDLARGVLLLEKTKTNKRREIPMNRAVYDVLAEIRARQAKQDDGDPSGVVFRRSAGRAWGSFRRAFERAVETAKLEDFHFHDLRHTFASWLVMRGRPLKEVQELLGHRTLAMTVRYSHLSPDRLRDAVASLDDFSTTSAQRSVEPTPSLVTTRQN